MTKGAAIQIIGASIATVGAIVLVLFGNWQVLLGVFLMLWGNNIQQAKPPRGSWLDFEV